MIKGDRVKWTYKYRITNGIYGWMTKEGEYLGLVRGSNRIGKVQFDGNKNPSKVEIEELEITVPDMPLNE